ncbi:MAG: PEP-CTERM sorting domain-containing protein [Phycisphaeraceae bacterium]|nr:PEP-CTERM sorting domain-containing protein [Phycisphaeraceae bacterium]
MKAKLVLLAGLATLVSPLATQAYIVNNSSSFDVAYGATSSGWNATETSSSNTPTGAVNGTPFTLGDFSITVTASGATPFSSQAVTFFNRVLAGDLGGADMYNNTFSVTVTYNGPAGPLGTTPGSEQVTLSIDSISIYGMRYTAFGPATTMNWEETTAGHTGTGPTVTVQNSTAETNPAAFTNIAWTTATDLTALGSTGTTITRAFQIPPGAAGSPGDPSFNPFDGFVVQGTANFSYDIPEPASLGLLALGAAALLGRRRS